MKFMTAIAVAGALLAAAPAYAGRDMAGGKSARMAEHGERHHGRNYAGHGAMRGGHGMRGGGHGGGGFMTTFDTDGDGRLTQAEIDKFRGDRLAAFDSDGNGSLSLSEYQAMWLAAMREKMVDRFQDLDADGDAAVTAEEFKRPYAHMVRNMDRNGDGVLTRQRMMNKDMMDKDMMKDTPKKQ